MGGSGNISTSIVNLLLEQGHDVPEFQPEISLEARMDQESRIPSSDKLTWEDEIIARMKSVF